VDPLAADILKFLAFGIIWLFPIAIIIGFSHADAEARQDDLGPTVVQFPDRTMDQEPAQLSFIDRIKRLAIPLRDG
jgi:hypothetical protein